MPNTVKEAPKTPSEQYEKLLKNFGKTPIYVLGDSMIDEYWHSLVERFSLEAPVPISLVKRVSKTLGGAANVLNNIRSLGGQSTLISRVGKDSTGQDVKTLIKKHSDLAHIYTDPSIQTTRKIRVLAGSHHLLRIDHEDTVSNSDIDKKVIKALKALKKGSILIVSDYNKGLVSKEVAKVLSKLASRGELTILFDPTPQTIFKIKNTFLLKPNRSEAENAVGKKIRDDLSNLKVFCKSLETRTGAKNILITLGKDGMALWSKGKLVRKPTLVKRVFDVSGAGDTVIATMALALSSGADLLSCMDIANAAAGVVVEKLGTATCTKEELQKALEERSV